MDGNKRKLKAFVANDSPQMLLKCPQKITKINAAYNP